MYSPFILLGRQITGGGRKEKNKTASQRKKGSVHLSEATHGQVSDDVELGGAGSENEERHGSPSSCFPYAGHCKWQKWGESSLMVFFLHIENVPSTSHPTPQHFP